MSKNKKRAILACMFILIGYFGSYILVRLTGGLTHFENRGYPEKGHEVRYPHDQWSDLASEMADESGNTLLKGQAATPRLVEIVFAPLCKIEASIWNTAN